eukprot:5557161-Pleurochrysis_carterae.AAC.2
MHGDETRPKLAVHGNAAVWVTDFVSRGQGAPHLSDELRKPSTFRCMQKRALSSPCAKKNEHFPSHAGANGRAAQDGRAALNERVRQHRQKRV